MEAAHHRATLSYRVFYFTLYSLGLRLSERLALTVADIDAVCHQVHIRDSKGIRIVKLLLDRIDLTVDGFVEKWRDLPRSKFVSECAKFGMLKKRSNLQPDPDPDPDPEVHSLISWVPLPPGLRTWRAAKPGKKG